MKSYSYSTASCGTTTYLTLIYSHTNLHIAIDDYQYETSNHDLILCRENSNYTIDKKDGFTIICFDKTYFNSLFLSQMTISRIIYEFLTLPDPKREHLYFSCTACPQIQSLFILLSNELDCDDRFNNKLVSIYTDALLTLLERARQQSLIVPNSTMISTNRFGRLMQYIGINYSDCTLKDVAEKFGYNPDYLSTRFKLITGMTFNEKITEIRLQQATEMLKRDELTIEEIADAIGYSDKGWFIKKFKEAYHLTPARYRKQQYINRSI